MNTPRWYVAHTHSRHEKKVVEHLRLIDVETLLPLYLSPRRWKNGMTMNLELPLFPGYVFMRTGLDKRVKILNIPSVVGIVSSGAHPVPVTDAEINLLVKGIAGRDAEPHPFMNVGDRVRLHSGPLAGMEGVLVRKKQGYRFVLSMDLIMQAVSVEVNPADVEHLPILPSMNPCLGGRNHQSMGRA